jgi:DNA-binding Lrp family transcriptional regulator
VRPGTELDNVDRALLSLLAADARTPNNALAEAVGIAPSTCLARIRRLQEANVITAFRTEIALEPLGRSLQALIAVRLQAHARADIGMFAERFAALPGVLNVFFLAGANDFLVHVAAHSSDDLREFVVRNLSASREFAGTETSLIFEHISSGSGALIDR